MHKLLHVLKHSILESIQLIPFLLIAFFIIEWIEHKLSKKSQKIISKSGKFGPVLGGLLGLVPQCGFSVVATNLYVTRIISLGTLISIYLSTSDEMLPILLSEKAPVGTIVMFLCSKFFVGLMAGIIIDIIFKKNKKELSYDICEDEHCGCDHEHNLLKSSLIHTLKTISFIFVASLIMNALFEFYGEEQLSKLFLKDTIFAPLITSLIGLIPNCGASVMLTELYLKGAISFAATLSGLLTGSGIAILVLFKTNKDLKDNFKILGLIYGIGVFVGISIEIIKLFV